MTGKHRNTREYCLNTLQILKDFDINLTKEEKKEFFHLKYQEDVDIKRTKLQNQRLKEEYDAQRNERACSKGLARKEQGTCRRFDRRGKQRVRTRPSQTTGGQRR